MTTLESASKRLESALRKLETNIATAASARQNGNSDDIESLRRQYIDLQAEHADLQQRHESLVDKNMRLSERLDDTISRLQHIDNPALVDNDAVVAIPALVSEHS